MNKYKGTQMELIKKEQTLNIENNTTLTNLQFEILNKRIDNEDILLGLLSNHLDITKFIEDALDNLPDLDTAINVINNMIANNKKILLVSDYDSDGINSAIVLEFYFKHLIKYDNYKVIINKRKFGNGFNKELTDSVIHEQPDLLITSDHGSSDEASYKRMKKELNNIYIIVTDHHLIPEDNYPHSADLLINNQRLDSNYSKEVSGCFITFILIVTMYVINDRKVCNFEPFYEIIPNVAISTISDVMSLLEPLNRKIVKLGINIINSGKYKKWTHFNKAFDIYDFITSKTMGWNIAPVLNTGNRLDREHTIFEIMSEVDLEEFEKSVYELVKLNKLRKNEIKRTMNNIRLFNKDNCCIILAESKYHINGIIANNIVKKYNKPAICFSKINKNGMNVYSGSGRSIPGVNIHNILTKLNNKNLLLKYGGHYGAVGVTLKENKLDKFMDEFNNELKNINYIPDNKIYYDIDIKNNLIDYSIVDEIRTLAPYGKDFAEPSFRSKFKISNVKPYNTFAKLYLLDKNNNIINATYWYNGETKDEIHSLFKNNEIIDIVFNIDINSYISNTNVNLNILGYKEIQ